MHCQQLHYWYSRDELLDRRIERFGSTPEVMRLGCPCGNAEGINDIASLMWPAPSLRGDVITCSIGAYTASALRELGSGHARLQFCQMTVQTRSNISA